MADDQAPTEGQEPPAPTPTTPPAPQAAPTSPQAASGDELGDGGRKALDEERRARRAADKALKDAAAELEKLRSASMSDQEKAVAQAKAAGRAEAVQETASRLVRAEVRALAAGKLADPADAIYLLGDLSDYVASDGDVDSKAIAKAIDALVHDKPYLAPQGSSPAPLPGGGATPSNGFSMDSWIRDSARRQGR